MDRRRHRARRQAPRGGERHPRTDDARAWPPSRPGARRGRLAPASGAAARQSRARHLAGAARRASRPLRRSRGSTSAGRDLLRLAPTRSMASRISARSAACCRSAIRIRTFTPRSKTSSTGFSIRAGAGPRGRALRACDAVRARLRPRSRKCAATGQRAELVYVSPKSGRAVSRAAASRGVTGCCACRLSCETSRVRPSATNSPTASRSPAFFCCATCWSRAARFAGRARKLHRRGAQPYRKAVAFSCQWRRKQRAAYGPPSAIERTPRICLLGRCGQRIRQCDTRRGDADAAPQ